MAKVARRQRRDRRGVEPTGQEHAQRYVADEMLAHGLVEQASCLRDRLIGRYGIGRRRRQRPIARRPRIRVRALVDGERVSGRKREDVTDRRPGTRDRPVHEEAVEGTRLRLVRHRTARHQGADLGGEVERGVPTRPVHRLDAETVPRQEKPRRVRPTSIEHDEAEHAAQMRHDVRPPLLVAVKNRLGVGVRFEDVPAFPQLVTELAEVVDLAVEADPEPAPGRAHRHTPARREIDDRQPSRAENDRRSAGRGRIRPDVLETTRLEQGAHGCALRGCLGDEDAPIVRTTMDLRVEHAQHGTDRVGVGGTIEEEAPGDAAHVGVTPWRSPCVRRRDGIASTTARDRRRSTRAPRPWRRSPAM